MVTALTAGYIYLLNWAPAGLDPEAYDLADGTIAEDYCAFQIPKGFEDKWVHGKTAKENYGGKSHVIRPGYSKETVQIRGEAASRTLAHYIKQYCFTHRTGTTVSYLVIKFGTNDYIKFWDDTETEREYCKGEEMGGSIKWQDSENLIHPVSINWKAAWT